MKRAFLAAAFVAGCTPAARPEIAAPASDAHDRTVAKLQEQVTALDGRIAQLERSSVESAAKRPAPIAAGWSCSAKCGRRSTTTTAFEIKYDRVTSSGVTAAQAYERLVNACNDTIYERVEDQHMLGGEMKNVCVREAASGKSGD